MYKTGRVNFDIPKGDDTSQHNITNFGGLHITDNPMQAEDTRASEMLNLYLNDDGVLSTRPRVEIEYDFGIPLNAVEVYPISNNRFLLVCETGEDISWKIYDRTAETSSTVVGDTSLIIKSKKRIFEDAGKIYILTGSNYVVIKFSDDIYTVTSVFQDSDTYLPTRYSGVSLVYDETAETYELVYPSNESEYRNILSNFYQEEVFWDGSLENLEYIAKGDTVVKNNYEKPHQINNFDKTLEYCGGSADGTKILAKEVINEENRYYLILNADRDRGDQQLVEFSAISRFGNLITNPFGTSSIESMTYNDGKIYCGSYSGKFAIYDISSGTFGSLITNPFGTSSIESMTYNDGKIYCGGGGGKFAIYNISSGTFGSLITNPFGTSSIYSMIYDNNKIYCGGGGGKFAIYNISSGTFGSLISTPFDSNITGMVYNDGNIYCGGSSGEFAIYNISSGTFGDLITNPFGTSNIYSMTYNDGKIYCGSYSGKFAIYDISSGTFGSLITNPFGTSSIESMTYNDGKIYCGGGSGKFAIYDISSGAFGSLISTPFGTSFGTSSIESMTYNDGKIYCGGYSGKFAICDLFINQLSDKALYFSKDFTTFYYHSEVSGDNSFSRIKVNYSSLEFTTTENIVSYSPTGTLYFQNNPDSLIVSSDGSKFACFLSNIVTNELNLAIFIQNSNTTSYSIDFIEDLDIDREYIGTWRFRLANDFSRCVMFNREGLSPNVAIKMYIFDITYTIGAESSTMTYTDDVKTLSNISNVFVTDDSPLGEISEDGDTYLIPINTNVGYYITYGNISSFTQNIKGVFDATYIENFPVVPITDKYFVGSKSYGVLNSLNNFIIVPHTRQADAEYFYIKSQFNVGKSLIVDNDTYINLYNNLTPLDNIVVKRQYNTQSDYLDALLRGVFYTKFSNNYWIAVDNKVYRSTYGNPTYFSFEGGYNEYGDTETDVTGFNILSDTVLCVYKEKGLFLASANSDSTGNIVYYITEAKTKQGNIPLGQALPSAVSEIPLQFNENGIFVLTQTENVQTIEFSAKSISQRIDDMFLKEKNKDKIITHSFRNWTYVIIPNSTYSKVYLLDGRTYEWFYWELPVIIDNIWTESVTEYDDNAYEQTKFSDANGQVFALKSIDLVDIDGNTDYYDIDRKIICWYWNSQIMPLSTTAYSKQYPAWNYIKQLISTGFLFVDPDVNEEYSMDYDFKTFDKNIRTSRINGLEGNMTYIRSIIKRTPLPKCNFIKLSIRTRGFDIDRYKQNKKEYIDEISLNYTNKPLNKLGLIGMKFKYKVTRERLS